jgi:hypothetical protein
MMTMVMSEMMPMCHEAMMWLHDMGLMPLIHELHHSLGVGEMLHMHGM